jgi:hypothetical protein
MKLEIAVDAHGEFNPFTKIEYSLLKSGFVKLTVFDINGKTLNTLINSFQNSGNHELLIDSKNMSSGVYFYKLETAEFIDVKKMVLIK